MNVLYVLNSGSFGGMERHVLDLITVMTQEGHTVYVWCPKGDISQKYIKAQALVFNNKIRLDIDLPYIFKLSRFIKEKNIDIIHAHELKAVVNSLLAGKICDVPVISHTHTPISEWKIPDLKKKIDSKIYSFFVNQFSVQEVALTQSRKDAKILEGLNPNKITIIPNAVDTSFWEIPEVAQKAYKSEICSKYGLSINSYVFGLISRISPEKGHLILLEAYRIFKEILKTKNISDESALFLAGGGILEPKIKEKIKEWDLKGVVITGKFPEEEKSKLYAVLDSFVFPSLAEGFGYVLVEAMANSLPVLCSDLEVLQEVGGSSVKYFETGNSRDLAWKMLDFYTRQDQYREFGKYGKQRVEELFSLDKFKQNYLDLYKKVLEQ